MCELISLSFFPGYPASHNQGPYPMPQKGGQPVAPYPVPPGGYGDPSPAPPAGFNMGYNPGQPPVMYQPGPVGPAPGPEYGVPPGAISPAPVGVPAAAPVGVPPGLEYLTQVKTSAKEVIQICKIINLSLEIPKVSETL